MGAKRKIEDDDALVFYEFVILCFRSITISTFLFFMNNLGGNLPILIQPVAGTCFLLLP